MATLPAASQACFFFSSSYIDKIDAPVAWSFKKETPAMSRCNHFVSSGTNSLKKAAAKMVPDDAVSLEFLTSATVDFKYFLYSFHKGNSQTRSLTSSAALLYNFIKGRCDADP